ncbi:MAG: hypothetical protein ACOZNI_01500 [Myxococcota bacterium]
MRPLVALTLLAVALGCGGLAQKPVAEGDEPGECEDGADNDRDGAFDCKDTECAGAPACQKAEPTPVAEPVKLAGKNKGKVKKAAAPVADEAADADVATAPAGGDCGASCKHLLRCAGQPELQAECVAECRMAGHDPEFLGWFQQQDCQTALTVVAMLSGGADQGGQASGGSAKGSQCDGCVWDGTECNWYSQSNWGSQNAYSGAVISCDPGCCR